MKKIIIGIHGLGNKPPHPLLEKWWKQSIIDGIISAGHTPKDFQFELVYWSDLLHLLPLDPDQADADNEHFLSEPYTLPAEATASEPKPARKKILDYLEKQMDRLLLNEDYSINFTAVTDSIIRRYFQDLDCYYSDTCMTVGVDSLHARSSIRKRLSDVLHKHRNKDILLLSHSMGSIVAYDVLIRTASDVIIDTWITAGSPLGLPIVISKIVSEYKKRRESVSEVRTPENVLTAWLNFSDLEDRVAIDYALAGDYKANSKGIDVQDTIVINRYTYNGKPNTHKSFGYFQTPEIGDAIHRFLTHKKQPSFCRWITHFLNKMPGFFRRKSDHGS